MSTFVVISDVNERSKELKEIIEDLEYAYHHKRIPSEDLKVTEPLTERQNEWDNLQAFLYKFEVDAVIMTPFLQNDLCKASYLLGPIRATEVQLRRPIKIILLTREEPNINLNGFTDPLNRAHCLSLAPGHEGKDILSGAIDNIIGLPVGPCLFVDDEPLRRTGFLMKVAEQSNLVGIADFCDFDEADIKLGNGNYIPQIVVSDVRETRTSGPPIGSGLKRMIQSSQRLCQVPVILFSTKFYNVEKLASTARCLDGAFIMGPNTANEIDQILNNP